MSLNSNTYKNDIVNALEPAVSVFVSANAGAGKTSLLTNRVLRLLLSGVAPHQILCLTFTNAAAAEMLARIQKQLGSWVMADDDALGRALSELTGSAPDREQLRRARGLFAGVLESPEGIRIQTIHGFAQSLLRRFPLEADVSPHFTVMDGRTEQELLQEARQQLLGCAQTEDPSLQQSLYAMACELSESSFHGVLAELIRNKRKLRALLRDGGGTESVVRQVWSRLHLRPDTTLMGLIDSEFTYSQSDIDAWREVVRKLRAGDEKEQALAGTITQWFADPASREAQVESYILAFLTLKGTPRKTLAKKATLPEALHERLRLEQEQVWRFNDKRKALVVARRTSDVLRLAEALLALYDALKLRRNLMDYDDLILSSMALLQKPGIAPWVLFKLDGGIDHILVDEAQDTSPEQWAIVDALTQEFFAGKGVKEAERSLFVVGDEKQSIYSFQGADPSALSRMQHYFAQRIEASGHRLQRLSLTRSYRSTQEVLAAVDAVFARPEARAGLTFEETDLAHIATRLEHPGLVELWPLVAPAEGETVSVVTVLARQVAETIHRWLKDGLWLEAKQRHAHAGDIMILVRNRTTLVDRLVRALKRRGVPVAGQDRMQLDDNLAVQDLVALGQVLLLPEDDLTLAALLKSPIFNLSEDALFELCWQRGDASVWERLRLFSAQGGAYAGAYELLADLRAKTDFVAPYELYSYLLETCGARKRFIGRMGEEYNDPIDEFLGQALLYERSHAPSLQGFLHWLSSSDSEIKRDMEEAGGSVRIMTVHGAKGLQAPIVVMPDTVEPPRWKDHLLWHETGMPFFPGGSEGDDAFCAGLRDEARVAMFAEYRRLLYVALTRAEDHLYMFGATSRDAVSEECWYSLIQQGMQPVATAFDAPGGQGLRMGREPSLPSRGRVRVGACVSLLEPSYAPLLTSPLQGEEIDFSFLFRASPEEAVPPKPLVPSKLADTQPAGASPIASPQVWQRGTLIHKLLQYLPQADDRQAIAHSIAGAYQRTMSEEERNSCIREAISVIENPEFDFLFTGEALAEVPVAGCITIAGVPVAVAGQIDRLHVGERELWIVDYKTGAAAPADPASTPRPYIRQMNLYRRLLQDIYPQKQVRCALLWTSEARLMPLADSLLDEAETSSYI